MSPVPSLKESKKARYARVEVGKGASHFEFPFAKELKHSVEPGTPFFPIHVEQNKSSVNQLEEYLSTLKLRGLYSCKRKEVELRMYVILT